MIACPSCGQENPDGFQFCGACGAPLAEEAPAEMEERKLVSVLFVDLVGHTAASDRADPEDVRARLRPYHRLLKREIEGYGGTVEKFVGDAVMAVFGAPVSHEDDAERAVRSAFRILEAVGELDLDARAAVATGEAVVSLSARPEQGEGIVAGDVVNTASRLQQAAAPGSLVVGEATFRATRDAIEYERLEPVSLKGKAEPVSLWRAVGARARFGVDAEAAPRTPFVGREHDLALIENAYARAVREQAVQLVTVTGEPGVGKTRLVAEFRSWLDERPERVRWRQGRCLPYGEGITFWALGEIVKAQAGILESDSPERAAEKLEAAVRTSSEDVSEHEWLVSRLAPLVGARTEAAPAERGESFTAWRRFFEQLAAQRPLVLLFEDLHWADAALFDYLDELVDWTSDVAVLVLCTARPELYERHQSWGGGKRNSTTVSLSPLTRDETARLVSALLSRAALPVETQAVLLERAGGNPLYAEEFVRMLGDRGMLTELGDLADGGEIALPETVHALIAARLDTLAPDRKALLHDASVVGKVFWPGAVAAIGGTEKGAVKEALRELVRKELVRPARSSSVDTEDEFSFWHLLVRDVAYGQIPRGARVAKHRAAAEWLESVAGERVADQAELLAEHYRQARELAEAAGVWEDDGELAQREARFLVLAGDRARNLDLAKSERYYRDALELTPEGPGQAELLAKLGQTLFGRGGDGLQEQLEVSRRAIAAYRKLGDDAGAAGTMADMSRALWALGDPKAGEEVLREALALLEGSRPGPELVKVYSSLAGQAMTDGRAEEAREWAEKGLRLTLVEEPGRVPIKVRLLQFAGSSRCLLGDNGGIDLLRESLRLGLESGVAAETALAYNNLAGLALDAEGPRAALEIYDQGVAFAEARGLVGFAAWTRGERVWSLFELGRWDETLAISEHYPGDLQIEVLVRTYAAYVQALRGLAAEAAAITETLLPRAREIAVGQILVPALLVGAVVERARGRHGDAVDLLESLLRVTRGKVAFQSAFASEAARLCLATGATDLLSRWLEGIESQGLARWRLSAESASAVLSEMEGRLQEAQEHQHDSARGWEELGFEYELAQARLARGRCLVRLGRPADAAGDLRQACELFGRLGARPLVSEAEGLISRAAVG